MTKLISRFIRYLLILFLFNSTIISRVWSLPLQSSYPISSYLPFDVKKRENISDIVKDHNGFIWLATDKGLYRFNGYEYQQFGNGSTLESSLPHFSITRLLIDTNQKLWVGTSNGLSIYHPTEDRFEQISLKNIKPNITTLFEDTQNNIWVGTYKHGVFKIANNQSVIEQIDQQKPIGLHLADNFVRSIYEDTQGFIWIATDTAVNKYFTDTQAITIYELQTTIAGLTSLHNGNILIGTRNGILELDQKKKLFTDYKKEIFNVINSPITQLIRDRNQQIIISTFDRGLFIFNLLSGKLIHYENNHLDNNSLFSNTIRQSYLDNENQLWLGTAKGFNKIDISQSEISLYQQEHNIPACLSGKSAYAIFKDSRDILWVGIEDKGLHRIDLKNNLCRFYDNKDIDMDGISLKNIFDIKEDIDGNILIATYKEGLITLEPESFKFSQFNLQSKETNELLKEALIYQMLVEKNGTIWLAMDNYGLAKIDRKKNTLSLPGLNIIEKLKSRTLTVQTIAQLDDTLWLGTYGQGLIAINKQTLVVEQFVRSNRNSQGVAEFIYSSKLDNNGDLWLGSGDYGLYKINNQNKTIKNYRQTDGLSNNSIWDIQVDSENKVWLGTEDGLSVFDQQTNTFSNYYQEDGLQSNSTPPAGFYDYKRDELWTGGENGFNKINALKLKPKNRSSKVFITDMKLNYEPVSISTLEHKTPLLKPLINTDELEVEHNQNNFSFSFVAINYDDTSRIKYQYKLENYDDWKLTEPNSRIAHYTNIAPGNYVFRVRASDREGHFTDNDTAIIISINPPWWKTNIAYFLYLLTLIASIYFMIIYRTRALKTRAIELEHSVTQRTQELAKEKHKVEQLLSRKNEEFANVSHEFRTPLTLILGPIAQLLKKEHDAEETNRLNVVQRNGYRLLRMVDQLLNLETFRIKSITQRTPHNTEKTIRLLTEAFADLAKEKNINLSIIELANANFEFTNDALEKIILNLLSNAIKYTKAGGNVTIQSKRTNNELTIQVTDTGIGIPADKLESIFERYHRVLDENSEQVTGAGIGLALVKSLVEAHQGNISAKSELGKGTQITINLPIIGEVDESQIKPHFSDELIAMELMGLTHSNATDIISPEPQEKTLDDKPLVLVIEDNADMRLYITDSIKHDFNILTAHNGEQGINIAIAEVPDLIISDVMMPIKDGYQVTETLRGNPITNHIPIILLTARGDRESRLKGWQQKADEYLTKPFDVEELKIRLNNLLEIRNILKKRFGEIAFQPPKSQTEIPDPLDKEQLENLDTALSIQQQKFLTNLNLVLEKIYANSETSITQIAEANHMSLRQLFRKIKSVVDMTPAEYLRRFRLEKAKLLLEQGQTVSFAAFEVGFSSHSYFGKCFKAQFGVSPSSYSSQSMK